jgi:hypothetical protein
VAIPKTIALSLRVKRACSEFFYFKHLWVFFRDTFFAKRGYNPKAVNKAFNVVRNQQRVDLLSPKLRKPLITTRVPFLVHYAANTSHIHKSLELAAALPLARSMFSGSSFDLPQKVVFKTGPNLKRRLIRASFAPACIKLQGSWKCNIEGCPICFFVNEGDTIKQEVSPECHYIRRHLNCNSRDVVYVVHCKKCNRLGVGETHEPKRRLMDYVRAAAHANVSPTSAVEKHFFDCFEHSPLDLSFTLVDALLQNAGFSVACGQ